MARFLQVRGIGVWWCGLFEWHCFRKASEVEKEVTKSQLKQELMKLAAKGVESLSKPDLDKGGKPEVEQADKPELEKGDKPDVEQADKPELEKGGKPEVSWVRLVEEDINNQRFFGQKGAG